MMGETRRKAEDRRLKGSKAGTLSESQSAALGNRSRVRTYSLQPSAMTLVFSPDGITIEEFWPSRLSLGGGAS